MAIIVPAILEKTKEDFEARAQRFERLLNVQRIQVDVADGKFVANTTVLAPEIDLLSPNYIWEAHLMVEEPVDFFDYQMLGFTVIIVHYEAFQNEAVLISSLAQIRKLGLKVGLAFNPETPVASVAPYGEQVDQFTVLSIHPGTQGAEFMPESLGRIAELRAACPSAIIEVDGGISLETAKSVADAGADLLVVGSALWDDTSRVFEDLQAMVA